MTIYSSVASNFRRSDKKVGKVITEFRYTENGQDKKWRLKIAKMSSICSGLDERMVFLVKEHFGVGEIICAVADTAEEARIEAEKQLADLYALRWSNKISVYSGFDNIGGSAERQFGCGIEVKFEYQCWQVSQKSDGKPVYRAWSPARVKPDWSTNEQVGSYIREGVPPGTLIDYDHDVEQKLVAVRDAFHTIQRNLKELLRPDKIADTLNNMKLLALPLPDKS